MEGELKQTSLFPPSWSWWQKTEMSSYLEESLLVSYPPVKKQGNGNTKYYRQARHKPSTNIKIIHIKSKACANIQQGTNFFSSKVKVQADILLTVRQCELQKSNNSASIRQCFCRNVCLTVFYTNYILHQALQRHQWISETKCLLQSWQCSAELCYVLIPPQTFV